MTVTRRTVLSATLSTTLVLSGGMARAARARAAAPDLGAQFAALEARAGGRLGIALFTDGPDMLAGNRAGERFALCSTFKAVLAALVLREAEQGRLSLEEVIAYSEDDLISHAPVTGPRVGEGGMPVIDLVRAVQITSDNPAANLLLRRVGGPTAVTEFLREIGDPVTRLDRYELALNYVPDGELRDTTTPEAMAKTIRTLLTGDVLSAASRAMLLAWMQGTTTGTRRLRAGFPENWDVGNKTGTSVYPDIPSQYNDLAIAFPPGGTPLFLTAYYQTAAPGTRIDPDKEAVLADVARLVTAALHP